MSSEDISYDEPRYIYQDISEHELRSIAKDALVEAGITLPKRLERRVHRKADTDKEYVLLIYECIGLSSKAESQDLVVDAEERDLTANIPYRFSEYDPYRVLEKEKDMRTETPFDVEEGILQCPSCKGLKTTSYSLQTRSGDEGMTVYAKCFTSGCGKTWKL